MTTDSETKTFTIQDAIKAAVDELAPEEEASQETAEPEISEETEVEETEVEEAETDETEEEESEEPESDETEEPETILAPENWSDEWKSEFDKLPDEGKQLALTQYKSFQSDYTKKLEPVADINKAIEPFSDQIAMAGATPGQLIQRLLAAHGVITRNPTDGILQLIQSYGNRVDLNALGKTLGLVQTETSEDEFIDPQTKALKDELSELKTTITQGQQTAKQTVEQQGLKILQDFEDAKDDDGNLLHPHYPKVKLKFAGLLRADPSITLEEAYEDAIWADKTLRKQVQEEQRKAEKAEADKKAETERKKKVTKAKASATKLPGKKAGSVADGNKPKSIKDFVTQAAKQVEGA